MHYIGESNHIHGEAECLGVLLANTGTPDAPTAPALRRYLKQFLWDPRVVEVARPLWWVILNGAILQVRPRRSAELYAKVWTPEGSPLLAITKAQGQALQSVLEQRLPGPVRVAIAMRYGHPSVAEALEQLRQARARRILVLPLYPQYSASTTGSIFDALAESFTRWRWVPELRFINHYYDAPTYIEALAHSVRSHWAQQGQQDYLMMSFHGVPRSYLLAGDPYHCHCFVTGRLLAEQLKLERTAWELTFQSRVGSQEWLKPYTEETLKLLPRQGIKRISVICPGFAADCLETLEEIAVENRKNFLKAGGEHYSYIPALNGQDMHIETLAQLVIQHTQGWPEAAPDYDAVQEAVKAELTRQRAMEKGASR
ncbi:ferrochelatase [Thiorhodospira sibirica]|uniref:ferrochelatase n=1 Tax=Thiorhodospira sibirica TaxID=154347 RepID=UPI00022C39E3|nr:ferrochelatase [Thiorhodospira sibirica]